ncbi:MAG TPA: hypothetical protein VGR26_04635 [Acidimicrobiales bacterium]|nr:hypothetical protein [Acidimicrobiales bacterium]
MQPGERIAVIKRIATRLGAEEDWAEIDLVLEQFGFGTEWRWEGNAKSYVLHCIKNNTDAKLAALDQYLMGHARPEEEPWEDGRFLPSVHHTPGQVQGHCPFLEVAPALLRHRRLCCAR